MDHIIVDQHFRVNIFGVTIDKQLQESNNRFYEHTMKLFSLNNSLISQNFYKAFIMNNTCAHEINSILYGLVSKRKLV